MPWVKTSAEYRMPAEWERHACTLMAWPTDVPIWAEALEQARDEYAATARAVARFEPVIMVVRAGDERKAASRCGPNVEVITLPIDDSWLRDAGPIVVRDQAGHRLGIDFAFNAYGERFAPYDNDARIAARLLEHVHIPARRSELVLEGGSIATDGEGTLITTEQCLLNANRNPGWTREEIEAELCAQLGATKVIWLRWGRLEDRHTDGHVDVVCMFARPGAVIVQGCTDRSNPNYERMRSNIKTLRAATDAKGRTLEIIELPILPLTEVCGQPTLIGNVNAYFTNGALIVPVADVDRGDGVVDLFQAACPEHEIVPVSARMIGFGGGGVHCITQQIPEGT